MGAEMRKQRVALYARVSTAEQNPENQLLDLRRHAQLRGWEIVSEFVDKGISGSKDSRPALNELMRAARRREIDTVLCWRFDRFGRSTRHLVMTLDEFRALGIAFVSHQDSIDTSTPAGRVTFTLIAAIAEFERELIRERVVAGLQRARTNGKRLGRPPVRPDSDPRELRASGMSLRAIAKRLGVSKSWVADALSRKPSRIGVNLSVEVPT